MVKVSQINSVNELLKLWPRIRQLHAEKKMDNAKLLQLFLTCIDYGAVFIVRADQGLVGTACVEHDGINATLHTLPRDEGKGYGRVCMTEIKRWGREHGLKNIQVTTNRLNGATYRYFEKSLGFRRKAVTFNMNIEEITYG